ncbi:phage tail protein [Metasolibacillus sp. FSL H7-0170]|uniref:phage tail-collar fiber domain-containing protein n=1 Tax=Metasolibacillus sp. FSL H7-0170 TaxID=2921431 RepID=UPI0031584753
MTQYGTIITNIGLAQIANAQVTQQKVGLEHIALGDGNGSYYIPTANQSALVNEVWRGPVSNVTIDPANDNRIIIEGLIPTTAGGFTIREIAVFDDQNQLIAVGQYPEKYKPQLSEGVAEETLIQFVIETNNADAVELSIDPTIIIASREYVDEKVATVSAGLVQLEEDFTTHLDNKNAHGLNKYYSLELAQIIEEHTDLNDIKSIGNYISVSGATTATLSNCPVTTDSGFSLKVERVTGDAVNFIRQTIKSNHQIPSTFKRSMINNVFSSWTKVVTADEENIFTKRTSIVLPNDSSHLILERTGISAARGSIGISSAGLDFRDSTTAPRFIFNLQDEYLQISNNKICVGTGSPEGVISAAIGSLYLNKNGGVGTTLYVKQSGTGNVGWVEK